MKVTSGFPRSKDTGITSHHFVIATYTYSTSNKERKKIRTTYSNSSVRFHFLVHRKLIFLFYTSLKTDLHYWLCQSSKNTICQCHQDFRAGSGCGSDGRCCQNWWIPQTLDVVRHDTMIFTTQNQHELMQGGRIAIMGQMRILWNDSNYKIVNQLSIFDNDWTHFINTQSQENNSVNN